MRTLGGPGDSVSRHKPAISRQGFTWGNSVKVITCNSTSSLLYKSFGPPSAADILSRKRHP